MGKYDPLADRLRRAGGRAVEMSFDEVADLVGGLPASAFKYQAWWANEVGGQHVQGHAWMGAGYRVEAVNLQRRWVRFAAG